MDIERFIKIESGAYLQDVSPHASLPDLLYTLPRQAHCAEVEASEIDLDTFFEHYWLPQRPVVIRNVKNVTNLPLLEMLDRHRGVAVGAKLSPDVEFEGVDSLLNWEMAGQQDVPKKVLQQLQSPDKVVVRAVS
jgi:hypothetical protein